MLFCEKPDSTFSQHALEHFPSKWMPVDRNMLYAPISMSAPGQLGPLHAIGGRQPMARLVSEISVGHRKENVSIAASSQRGIGHEHSVP
jgi:hypothetical protein